MFDITMPGPEKFIWPVFVIEGDNKREPIDAMPGQSRLTADCLVEDLKPVVDSGIASVLIFGVVDDTSKDTKGSSAHAADGVVQKAVQAVRSAYPHLVILTDVCMCAYTDHGHCGILDPDGTVNNDVTNHSLAQIALSHAKAGADIVSPSAMMDGQVSAIRAELDSSGCQDTLIMSYSTKFASSMYGPFREAEKSTPQAGDRKAYQQSYGDPKQALRESLMDEEEGADILMVKPALLYLDIISQLRDCTDLPIAAYNVSGEYSALIASADRGWGDLKGMVRESTTAMVRAGTDLVISYWANKYEELLKD
jgi:porphobilinogen synthase